MPEEVAADPEMVLVVASLKYIRANFKMVLVVASLKYIRANFTVMKLPEQYLYESLSTLTAHYLTLRSLPQRHDCMKLAIKQASSSELRRNKSRDRWTWR